MGCDLQKMSFTDKVKLLHEQISSLDYAQFVKLLAGSADLQQMFLKIDNFNLKEYELTDEDRALMDTVKDKINFDETQFQNILKNLATLQAALEKVDGLKFEDLVNVPEIEAGKIPKGLPDKSGVFWTEPENAQNVPWGGILGNFHNQIDLTKNFTFTVENLDDLKNIPDTNIKTVIVKGIDGGIFADVGVVGEDSYIQKGRFTRQDTQKTKTERLADLELSQIVYNQSDIDIAVQKYHNNTSNGKLDWSKLMTTYDDLILQLNPFYSSLDLVFIDDVILPIAYSAYKGNIEHKEILKNLIKITTELTLWDINDFDGTNYKYLDDNLTYQDRNLSMCNYYMRNIFKAFLFVKEIFNTEELNNFRNIFYTSCSIEQVEQYKDTFIRNTDYILTRGYALYLYDILYNNSVNLFLNFLQRMLQPSPYGEIKPDGTGHHHERFYPLYITFISVITNILQNIESVYIGERTVQDKAISIYNTLINTSNGKVQLPQLGGRHPFTSSLPFSSDEYFKNNSKYIDYQNLPDDIWNYPYGLTMVMRKNGKTAGIVGTNSTFIMSEIDPPSSGKNYYGRYQCDSTIMILNNSKTYEENFMKTGGEGWDWNHYPLTISYKLPFDELKSSDNYDAIESAKNSAHEVGGLVSYSGDIGVFMTNFNQLDYTDGGNNVPHRAFNKVDIFYDGKIFTQGKVYSSGLDTSKPTVFTIDQEIHDSIQPNLLVDGAEVADGETVINIDSGTPVKIENTKGEAFKIEITGKLHTFKGNQTTPNRDSFDGSVTTTVKSTLSFVEVDNTSNIYFNVITYMDKNDYGNDNVYTPWNSGNQTLTFLENYNIAILTNMAEVDFINSTTHSDVKTIQNGTIAICDKRSGETIITSYMPYLGYDKGEKKKIRQISDITIRGDVNIEVIEGFATKVTVNGDGDTVVNCIYDETQRCVFRVVV